MKRALPWVLGVVILTAVLVVGLFGYGAWRFVQAAEDTEGKGSEPKGLLARAVYGSRP